MKDSQRKAIHAKKRIPDKIVVKKLKDKKDAEGISFAMWEIQRIKN